MIQLELSPEQLEIQLHARKFARELMAPVAPIHDREGSFPLDLLRDAHKQGFLTPLVPKEYGGREIGCLGACIQAEELASACMGIYVSIFVSTLALYPIVRFGTPEQKERFLKPFCDSFSLASYCLSEKEAGSDPSSMKTLALFKGDHYVLNGTKMWITNGGYADLYLVFATRDPALKHKGILALIVPRNLEGYTPASP